MISVIDLSLSFQGQKLFDDVNLTFTPGNCYGVIGANGAGKSTFLKILEGRLEPDTGSVAIKPNTRMSFLEQDHFKFEDEKVIDVVIMGNARLMEIIRQKEAIYAKEDFSDEKLKKAGIEKRYYNKNLSKCIKSIVRDLNL